MPVATREDAGDERPLDPVLVIGLVLLSAIMATAMVFAILVTTSGR